MDSARSREGRHHARSRTGASLAIFVVTTPVLLLGCGPTMTVQPTARVVCVSTPVVVEWCGSGDRVEVTQTPPGELCERDRCEIAKRGRHEFRPTEKIALKFVATKDGPPVETVQAKWEVDPTRPGKWNPLFATIEQCDDAARVATGKLTIETTWAPDLLASQVRVASPAGRPIRLRHAGATADLRSDEPPTTAFSTTPVRGEWSVEVPLLEAERCGQVAIPKSRVELQIESDCH